MLESLKARRDAAEAAVYAAGWFPGADRYAVFCRAGNVAPEAVETHTTACADIARALRGTKYDGASAEYI